MRRPVVEVVRRRVSRSVEPPSAPLPPAVLSALGAIVRDMRDVPRDCIRDPAELVTWLRRMARRVEGVGRMRVPTAAPALLRPAPPQTASKITTSLAQAVFGNRPKSMTKPVERRTVTSRKGRVVKVETRRSRAPGQLELQI